MLYGVPPFKAPTEKELYHKIMKGAYYFPNESKNEPIKPLPTDVSEEAKDMITKMLSYKFVVRPTAS
jgi:serine/threonine protein kinase